MATKMTDAQLGLLATEAYHGLHEVVAKRGVEPRRADDHRTLAEFLDVQLAYQLRLAIDAVGTGVLVLGIGCVVGAVEDVVRGDLYHPPATLAHGMRQVGGSLGIEALTERFVVLGLIDGGIGGTVDDSVDVVLRDEGLYGLLVGDV